MVVTVFDQARLPALRFQSHTGSMCEFTITETGSGMFAELLF